MSWRTFYQRRDAMDAALDAAARNPGGPLPYAGIPGVTETFADRTELLLALQLRWTRKLEGPLDLAGHADDAVTGVTDAWQRTAAANPTLRAVLDAHLDINERTRAARDEEYRMLALFSGLAEYHEPREEITRIGAAFAALLAQPRPRANAKRRRLSELLAG